MRRLGFGILFAAGGYVVGAVLTYFLIGQLSSNTHDRSIEAAMTALSIAGGVLAAISVLFWLPYVVSFPALLLARPILNPGKEDARGHLAFGVAFTLAAAVTLLALHPEPPPAIST